MKKINGFLNKDGFLSIATSLAIAAIDSYNIDHDTDHELDDSKQLKLWLECFILVTFLGWSKVDLSKFPEEVIALVKIPKDYEGVDATTQARLDRIEVLEGDEKDQAIDDLVNQRTDEISEILAVTIYQYTQIILDKENKFNIIATTSAGDDRVRPYHAACSGHYWVAGTRQDPCEEINCRCLKRSFKTTREAEAAGFSPA